MVFVKDTDKLIKKIKGKIINSQKKDKLLKELFPVENINLETFNLCDALQMVTNLESDECFGCGCTMLFYDYTPWCGYQFVFDRINNHKIHSIENLNIVCSYCNTYGYNAIKASCYKRCHVNSSMTRPEFIYQETGDSIKTFDYTNKTVSVSNLAGERTEEQFLERAKKILEYYNKKSIRDLNKTA